MPALDINVPLLPTLADVLLLRQAIHPTTAEYLGVWQRRSERDACPASAASLEKIIQHLGALPGAPAMENVSASHLIEQLVADLRQEVIADLNHPTSSTKLQAYAERLGALVKTKSPVV